MFYKNLYENLLIEYADALVRMQDRSGDPAFNGGIKCQSCKNIHGRCIDAVFGLTVAYKLTKNEDYLYTMKMLFDYGENLMCLDGGLYNDIQTEWRYTTTFHEIAIIEARIQGEDIFDQETKNKFDNRIKKCAEWLYNNLNEFSYANINYATTNGLALGLAGEYLNNNKYRKQARHLIDYALEHFTKDNILFGETKPHNAVSKKGCRAVDIGYNIEESVPALTKYAFLVKDKKLISTLEKVAYKNLEFILPDGGVDNSFGNRNNKWTYWGSRTSDGVHAGFLHFADKDSVFAEASLRNIEMLRKCTVDGILYGGPDYVKHGDYGCTHHMFEHINSLAYCITNFEPRLLDRNLFGKQKLPLDDVYTSYIEDLRVLRAKRGDYFATFSDYDYDTQGSGHASGLTLTCLFKGNNIPMIMGSVTDYVLVEPTNMQVPLDREHHRSLLPRIEKYVESKRFSSTYFDNAKFSYVAGEAVVFEGTTGLESKDKQVLDNMLNIKYELSKNGIRIEITALKDEKFILPLINGKVKILNGKLEKQDDIFFLTGGFEAKEYSISPLNGKIVLEVY